MDARAAATFAAVVVLLMLASVCAAQESGSPHDGDFEAESDAAPEDGEIKLGSPPDDAFKPPKMAPLPVVTMDTLFDNLAPHRVALVLFRQWPGVCELCDLLEEELVDTAHYLANTKEKFTLPIFKVDCDDARDAAAARERYGVEEFPAMKLFGDGHIWPNAGLDTVGFSFKSIIRVLLHALAHPAPHVNTIAQARDYVPTKDGGVPATNERIIIFGFFEHDHTNNDVHVFNELAVELRDSQFYTTVYTTAEAVKDYYGVRDTFAIFRPGGEPGGAPVPVYPRPDRLAQHHDVDEMLQFIATHGLPRVATADVNTSFLFHRSSKPVFRLYADLGDKQNAANVEAYRAGLAKVASAVPEMTFTIAHVDHGDHNGLHVEMFDYSAATVQRGGAWAIHHQGHKFRPEEDPMRFSVEGVEAFAKRYLSDNPPPKHRPASSSLATANSSVVSVDGKTFRHVVFDESKLVLLLMYAPWSEKAMDLMPTWERLARFVAKELAEFDIVIAKIDATEHSVPRGYDTDAFPTVRAALPGHKTQPRTYEGPRTMKGYVEFIDELLTELTIEQEEKEANA